METPTPTSLRRPVVRRYRNRSLDVATGALVLVLFASVSGETEATTKESAAGRPRRPNVLLIVAE